MKKTLLRAVMTFFPNAQQHGLSQQQLDFRSKSLIWEQLLFPNLQRSSSISKIAPVTQ